MFETLCFYFHPNTNSCAKNLMNKYLCQYFMSIRAIRCNRISFFQFSWLLIGHSPGCPAMLKGKREGAVEEEKGGVGERRFYCWQMILFTGSIKPNRSIKKMGKDCRRAGKEMAGWGHFCRRMTAPSFSQVAPILPKDLTNEKCSTVGNKSSRLDVENMKIGFIKTKINHNEVNQKEIEKKFTSDLSKSPDCKLFRSIDETKRNKPKMVNATEGLNF